MYTIMGNRLLKDNVLIGSFESEEIVEYLLQELNECSQNLKTAISDAESSEYEISNLEDDLDIYKRDYGYLEDEIQSLKLELREVEDTLAASENRVLELENELSEFTI